jgi:large repetitive protein
VASSTVALSWTNNAVYGGLMGFHSYQVDEQINGGSFSTIATLTSASTTTFDVSGVTGLNTGTSDSFYIYTTDYCNGCSQSESNTAEYTSTNTVTHLSIAQPVASPASVQVGQSTQFSVAVTGGNGPYTYSWTGLPAGCSPANENPITCGPSSSGSSSVTVTVTDSRGITLTSLSVTVTVTAASGGGEFWEGGPPALPCQRPT